MVEVLTVEEIAERLRVNKQRIYRLVRAGRIPAVRVGRVIRVPVAELEWWIKAGGTRRLTRDRMPNARDA